MVPKDGIGATARAFGLWGKARFKVTIGWSDTLFSTCVEVIVAAKSEEVSAPDQTDGAIRAIEGGASVQAYL
jgi:hypothetical protein